MCSRPTGTGERRTERRVRVRLPIEVQGTDRKGERFIERTASEDLCRGGIAFALSHELDLNTEIEVIIPLPRQGGREESDFATRGRVRHIRPGASGLLVGVQFTGPRFRYLFMSETAEA